MAVTDFGRGGWVIATTPEAKANAVPVCEALAIGEQGATYGEPSSQCLKKYQEEKKYEEEKKQYFMSGAQLNADLCKEDSNRFCRGKDQFAIQDVCNNFSELPDRFKYGTTLL
jgi:hypothetical protein